MTFFSVYVVAPDGRRYNAEVEKGANTRVILDHLVKDLQLPASTDHGEPITYHLSIVNAERIQQGVTVAITANRPLPSSHTAEVHLHERLVISGERSAPSPQKVFIVHGHDAEAKHSVARFVEKLDLKPVILEEQASQGSTIIEKLERYSGVDFAVVLLTPDDEGFKQGEPKEKKSRARQNVFFELGYFVGKLNRGNVCLLYKEGVDIPSDLHGVVYVKMDPDNGWKIKLAKELHTAGLWVDMDKLL